jgi:sulfur-oxidizing protein SoxX
MKVLNAVLARTKLALGSENSQLETSHMKYIICPILMPMFATRVGVMLCLIACLAGCAKKDDMGYTLPSGNAERGQAAFVTFRCFDCHRVQGVELPVGEEPDQAVVELGGPVNRTRTYGDLVTGIINPSHNLAKGYTPSLVAQDGKSRMTVYNDVMTVSQLIDIVAFLQAHYELQPHTPTTYPQLHFGKP